MSNPWLLASFAALLGIVPAAAASLRSLGTLSGPTVHIADLWDDAGPAGARVLGPAPAPGGRITVGAGQLSGIARAYGVDWQSASAADEAVLDRPGAPLPLASVIDALRTAMAAQGTSGAFDVALLFYDPPMLDAGAAPRLQVEQLQLDTATGRFTTVIVVQTATADPLRLRLAGSVVVSVAVMVPTRRLLPGAVIGSGDLVVQQVRSNLISVAVVQDPLQAAGMQLRHMQFPGQPVPLSDLQHPAAVAKGDRVMMALALPGLDLGAVGQAMEGGAIGDRIAVRNPVSGAVLTAEIIAAGQVKVDPEAAPVLPVPRSGFAVASR